MKKSILIAKLNLKKTALSQLSKVQLTTIIGGADLTNTCNAVEKHMPSSPVICK